MYLHDVWVNWADGMNKGYNIPEFHEWNNKKDEIELMDQIPLVYVTSELFDFIENDFDVLPDLLLAAIKEKAYRRKNHERENVTYAAIVTDGKGVMAIDTNDEKVPNFKSRLIPRQDQIVFQMIEGKNPSSYLFEGSSVETGDLTAAGRIINIDNVHMYGLTRKEKEMKELLVENLFRLLCSENQKEVEYFFTELFPKVNPAGMTIEGMVESMSIFAKKGWSEEHETFGATLAKYFDSYDDAIEKGKKVEEA